jgi:tetratricopeptide (TPR) repeat protein
MGAAVSGRGDVPRAIALQEESAALYRKLGDDRKLAVVLNNLGYRLFIQGEHEQGRRLSEEALSIARLLGDRTGMQLPLINLGLAALLEGRYEDAFACYSEAFRLAQELGYVVPQVYALDGLAAVLAATGAAGPAATVVAAAQAAAQATGASLEPFEQEIHEQTIEAVRRALGDEAFAVAWEAGSRLTVDEAAERVVAGASGEAEIAHT